MKDKINKEWWRSENEDGFFGIHYLMGDDSEGGPYRKKPMTLSERTMREVNYIINTLGLTATHHLLDCPCGYGRHSIELAKRGVKVTGVDLNNDYLQFAIQEMKEQGIPDSKLKFIYGDMRKIPMDAESVDALINMFTSIGFFETDEDNMKVFREFSRVLKKDGALLIHLDYNPIKVRIGRWYDENHQRNLKSGARLLINEQYDPTTGRINGSWTIVEPTPSTPNHKIYYSLRVYSPQEFKDMLVECGFTDVEIFGDLEEPTEELREQSRETVIKAIKR